MKLKEEKNSDFTFSYASKTLENMFPAMMESFEDLFESVGQSDPHTEREENAEANSSIATKA